MIQSQEKALMSGGVTGLGFKARHVSLDCVQRHEANAAGVGFKGGTWRRMREIC